MCTVKSRIPQSYTKPMYIEFQDVWKLLDNSTTAMQVNHKNLKEYYHQEYEYSLHFI